MAKIFNFSTFGKKERKENNSQKVTLCIFRGNSEDIEVPFTVGEIIYCWWFPPALTTTLSFL